MMANQKKVSKESVLRSRKRTQCVDFSMAQSKHCRMVGTLGNDSLIWRMGMAEYSRRGHSDQNACGKCRILVRESRLISCTIPRIGTLVCPISSLA